MTRAVRWGFDNAVPCASLETLSLSLVWVTVSDNGWNQALTLIFSFSLLSLLSFQPRSALIWSGVYSVLSCDGQILVGLSGCQKQFVGARGLLGLCTQTLFAFEISWSEMMIVKSFSQD